jgi:hypothetical protein
MLGWRENVGGRDKLKEYVPEILQHYIGLSNVTQNIIKVAIKATQYHKEIKSV